MKLNVAVSVIANAAERLGLKLDTSISRIQLLAEIGRFIQTIYENDKLSVIEGSNILEEYFVLFFKTKTDNAAVAEQIGKHLYRSLIDEAGLTDISLLGIIKACVNTVQLAEQHFYDSQKSLRTTAFLQEETSFDLQRGYANSGAAADRKAFNLEKAVLDNPALVDDLILEIQSSLKDNVSLVDTTFNDIEKSLNSDVRLTDDVDGEASILDDQVMQFVKTKSDTASASDDIFYVLIFIRDYTDDAFALDSFSFNAERPLIDGSSVSDLYSGGPSKNLIESALISDAGSLRSQGYCDFTYFAEDFVGASRTF